MSKVHKDFINFIFTLASDWFSLRKNMYFIVIRDIFLCSKKKEIMIKYQCINKRIGDIIALEDFMRSPLKHAVHPNQIFQIGLQTERYFQKLNFSDDNLEPLTRFKKIFYT